MLSKLHSLNLKLCGKPYNKNFVLHLIVAPQLGGGWQLNYSTKTRQAKQRYEKKDEASKGESESHLSVEVFSSKTSFPFTTFRDSLDMNLG